MLWWEGEGAVLPATILPSYFEKIRRLSHHPLRDDCASRSKEQNGRSVWYERHIS